MANAPVEVKKTVPAPAPDAWRSLRAEMDRLFDRFAGGWGMPSLPRLFANDATLVMPSPAVDITEDDVGYKLTAELPGMDEKEVEVAITGDMLTLNGEKRLEKEMQEKNLHLCERSYGSFRRSFYLPEGVDPDKITAEFTKGVLTISMPKSAKAAEPTKKIEVKAAA
jgi:HSP20 family protein